MHPAIVTLWLVGATAFAQKVDEDESRPASRPRVAALLAVSPSNSAGNVPPEGTAPINDTAFLTSALQYRGFRKSEFVMRHTRYSAATTPRHLNEGRERTLSFFDDMRRRAAEWSEGDVFLLISVASLLETPEELRSRAGFPAAWRWDGTVELVFWDEVWSRLKVPPGVRLFVLVDAPRAASWERSPSLERNTFVLGPMVGSDDLKPESRTDAPFASWLWSGREESYGLLAHCAAVALATQPDVSAWFDATLRAVRARGLEAEVLRFPARVDEPKPALPGVTLVDAVRRRLALSRVCIAESSRRLDVNHWLQDSETMLRFAEGAVPTSVSDELD